MYVYALTSEKDNRIYVGMTKNLDHRLKEHNAGHTKSTKGFRPWKLHHSQKVNTILEARKLELEWKSGSGKEYLKKLK